jgi:UDPglucose 6-dehydrogenase
MKISVVGTGYVGLVVGTCLAETGNEVDCVDVDQEKVAMLNEGRSPLYEPGLSEMIQRNLIEHRLRFTADLAGAVQDSH